MTHQYVGGSHSPVIREVTQKIWYIYLTTLIKKIKFFSYIRKFRVEQLQSQI
jgi:hypothetical protein